MIFPCVLIFFIIMECSTYYTLCVRTCLYGKVDSTKIISGKLMEKDIFSKCFR